MAPIPCGAPKRPLSTSAPRICGLFSCYSEHTKLESTVRYLGIEVDDALEIAEQIEV